MTDFPRPAPARTSSAPGAQILFSVLVRLTSLTILLQLLGAGMYIREGQDNDGSWVEVHDRGGRISILLALIATAVAVARIRHSLPVRARAARR